MDESVYRISFCVTSNEPLLVLIDPSNEIARYTDIQCAAGTACEDVQVELFQGRRFLSEIAETSPAMTNMRWLAFVYRPSG